MFCRSEIQRMLIEATPCGEDCIRNLAQSMRTVIPENFLETMTLPSLNAIHCLFSSPFSIPQIELLSQMILKAEKNPFFYFVAEVISHFPKESLEFLESYRFSSAQVTPNVQQRLFFGQWFRIFVIILASFQIL